MKPDAAVSVFSTQDKVAAPEIDRTRTVRDGLICVAIFAAGFWISWPVAQMGFVDDWSYIKTAQVFAQTGHFVYNGWATAMLGWQILWGALFIRLFGFSFMTVKLSTFPIACASVFLFYVIQIRFGIRPRNAIIGTLTLALSPLFLPLAASFMTDIPGLFVILLCLYCCQRAIAAPTSASTIAWLSLAAASNVAGGTVRQIAWLGALVMVPSTAWFLRKRRGVLPAGALLWAGTFAGVLYCIHWFAAQPYALAEPIFTTAADLPANPYFIACLFQIAEFLFLLVAAFPILIAWLPHIRTASSTSLLAIAILVLLWVPFQIVSNWTMPWIPDAYLGILSVFLPHWARLIYSALILVVFLLVLATTRSHFCASGGFIPSLACRPMFWLIAPYSLAYFAMLFIQGTHIAGDSDRYLLGVLPVAILLFIRVYEFRISPHLPAISVATLALYILITVAGTHDWFAFDRAQLSAIAELRAAGIPRTEIQAGMEYDGWTQIENGSYINDPRIRKPPEAYHPNNHLPPITCVPYFDDRTPALRPVYAIADRPLSCLPPSKFPPVQYRSWLPPFRGTVYVQEVSQTAKSAR